jgi:FkbM family methyltransferase
LKPGDLIFDIGANQGYKTDIFLKLVAAVVAVDPDEYNQETLRRSFLSLRLAKNPVTVVGKAVSATPGTQTIWIDTPGGAMNTLSKKWVDLLRADSNRFGAPLEFKIDVEGHEPEVLRGLGKPVPYVSFEVNLPEFISEGEECVNLLAKLTSDGRFNYMVDCARGLELTEWVSPEAFLRKLRSCADKSIEVLWTSRSDLQVQR